MTGSSTLRPARRRRSRARAAYKRSYAPIEACRIIPERCMSRLGRVNFCVSDGSFVLIDSRWPDNRIISALGDQHRLADLRQEIVIIQGAREQRLTDIRWNRYAKAQHQVQLLGRELLGETESQQRFKTAYTLFHILRKETRYEAEKLGSEHRDRLVTAKLRYSADKIEAADAILPVMPEVVEDNEWAVGPATQKRMIKSQILYDCIDVIGPQS